MRRAENVVDVACLAVTLQVLVRQHSRTQHVVTRVLTHGAFPEGDELVAITIVGSYGCHRRQSVRSRLPRTQRHEGGPSPKAGDRNDE